MPTPKDSHVSRLWSFGIDNASTAPFILFFVVEVADSLWRTPAAGQVAHPQAGAIRRAESQNAAARSCAVSASCVAPVAPEPETRKAALADGLGVAPHVVLSE